MRNLSTKARSPWLNGLRRILFSLPPVRRMVLRHHATQVRRSTGMVIQEVSLPYQQGDPVANALDAARLDMLEESANTAVGRTSKPHKIFFVSFLVPEPLVEVEVSEEWVRANPMLAAEFMEYQFEKIAQLEKSRDAWKELSQL